jgi:hypothetical protein
MFCSSCGAQVAADSAFCASCGANAKGQANAQDNQITAPVSPAAGVSFLKTKNGQIAAGAVGAVVLLGAIFLFSGGGGPNLGSALSSCGLSSESEGVLLGDGGNSLFLDGEGEEDFFGISYSDQLCVLDELNVPEIVLTQMQKTSALMGVQDADWDGLLAEWTYHPDKGFELSISKG